MPALFCLRTDQQAQKVSEEHTACFSDFAQEVRFTFGGLPRRWCRPHLRRPGMPAMTFAICHAGLCSLCTRMHVRALKIHCSARQS